MKGVIMLNAKKLGSQIKKYRKRCGLTQVQLAEGTGLSPTHISHIETGNSLPSLEVFIKISNILTVSPNNLLEGNCLNASWKNFHEWNQQEDLLANEILFVLKHFLKQNQIIDEYTL